MNAPVLLVPEVRRGHGMGHLVRCLRIAAANPRRYRVLLPLESRSAVEALLEELGFPEASGYCLRSLQALEQLSFVVLDRPWSDVTELPQLDEAPVVALDLGGSARLYCCGLIDTLPRVGERSRPNLLASPISRAPAWGAVGRAAAEADEQGERVLVTFGGDDPARLTRQTVDALVTACSVSPEQITVIEPPRASGEMKLGQPVEVRNAESRIELLLQRFHTVVTSFGMTAFEAVEAGCGVVLIDPSRYHARLSRKAGFAQAGVKHVQRRRLRRALRQNGEGTGRQSAVVRSHIERPRVAELLDRLAPTGSGSCPLCGSKTNRVLERFADRSYKRCSSCGIIYMQRLTPTSISYDRSYFFDEYKAQYGKSYLEDFAHIAAMGRTRLERIESLKANARSVLDVGCAYGPFLHAAKDRGYDAFGIDVSHEAVSYVTSSVGAHAVCAGIEEFSPWKAFGQKTFDVVTMWYVIEHLTELGSVLERVASMLPPGGVFGFSTPSGAGISARRSRRAFLQQSPSDHYTVWEPARAADILERFGFTVRMVVSTGHHPERFPGYLGLPTAKALSLLLSRAFRLGDTFELYAVKRGESRG